MLVFARRSLVPDALKRAASLPAGECALLLEGDWGADDADSLLSLDTYIDAARFAYLDADAERLTTQLAAAAPQPNFADINALRLRYAAIRWLRIIAFWNDWTTTHGSSDVDLYVSPRHDDEYVLLWRALSRALGFTLRIHFVLRDGKTESPFTLPRNALWRRALSRIFANRASHRDRSSPAASAHRPRLLFVGNPRILDPVCDAALDRGAHVSWLYDRFAVGAWWKRRASGIAWLTCDGDLPQRDAFPSTLLAEIVSYAGIALNDVIEAWFRRWRRRLAAVQSRQWHRVAHHLTSLRPSRIVLDEDATPLARIVVAQSARLGIPTTVVQHGVCCVRFGFAPLTADLFCAWDDATRRQLTAWGVAAERIAVTGPTSDQLAMRAAVRRSRELNQRPNDEAKPRRIVLLCTMPPRDDRPDAVEFHLTTGTYTAMLDAACRAVAELADAELIVKLHPRAANDPILVRTLALLPKLKHQIVARSSLAEVLASADCVLSCVSSAGIDAAVAGLPVVQLLPQGSGPILPAEWYGLLGSARTLDELRPLLRKAFECATESTRPVVEAPTGDSAKRIVDLLLAPSKAAGPANRQDIPRPHYLGHIAPFASEVSARD